MQPENRKNDLDTPAGDKKNLLDELRGSSGAGGSREIIPWWILAGVFAVVLAVVLWLMLPPFPREYSRFQSLRYQRSGQFEKAIPYLEWLKERLPKDVTILSELGNAYMRSGKWEEAIRWFSEAQDNIVPDEKDDEGRSLPIPDFNRQIGESYLRMNDLPKAEEYLKRALAFDKLDKYANFSMGELQFQKGNMPAATESFKMVARDPLFAEKVKGYYRKIEDRLFAGIGVDASLKGTTTTLATAAPAPTPSPTPVPAKGPTVTWGTTGTRRAAVTSPPAAANPATTVPGTAAGASTATR